MYRNITQQLAHHTVNGCNINVGEMIASGTISGPTSDSFGSMLELAWKGTKPVKLEEVGEGKFIEDGNSVIMKGYGYFGLTMPVISVKPCHFERSSKVG
jgi:fumarylacetoacetase